MSDNITVTPEKSNLLEFCYDKTDYQPSTTCQYKICGYSLNPEYAFVAQEKVGLQRC